MGLLDSIFRRKSVDLDRLQWEQRQEELVLEQLADECGLDWPRDKAKLVRIQRHMDGGGSFTVCKQLKAATGARLTRPVMFVDNFPTETDVEQECSETYGGGKYLVFAGRDRSRVLKVIHLEGEDRSPVVESGGKKSGSNLRANLDSLVASKLGELVEDNPELLTKMAVGVAEKQLRVKLTDDPKPEDPMDAVVNALRRNKEIKELIEGESGDWKQIIGDVAKEVLPALAPGADKFLKSRAAAESQEEQPASGPVYRGSQPALGQSRSAAPGRELPADQPPRTAPAASRPQPAASEGQVTGAIRLRPAQPGQPGQPPSRTTQPAQTPAQPDAVSIDLPDVDWSVLLTSVDWPELESKVDGPPADFIRWCYLQAIEEESQPHEILTNLFHDNPPDAVIAAFAQASGLLQSSWVRGLVAATGNADALVIATRIVEKLSGTQEGKQWVAQSHVAARMIQARIDAQGEGGGESSGEDGGDDSGGDEGEPGPVVAEESAENQTAEDLMESVARSPNGNHVAEANGPGIAGTVVATPPVDLDDDESEEEDGGKLI